MPLMSSQRTHPWEIPRGVKGAAAILVVGLFLLVAALDIDHDGGEQLLQRGGHADTSAPDGAAASPTGDGDGVTAATEDPTGAHVEASGSPGSPGSSGSHGDPQGAAGAEGNPELIVDPSVAITGHQVPGAEAADEGPTAEDLAHRVAADLLAQPLDQDIDPDAFEQVGGTGDTELVTPDPATGMDPVLSP